MSEILIISAHPDDMEIGMGGTVAMLAAKGAKITSLILTDGRRSPNPFAFPPDEMSRIRRQEAETAREILGIKGLISFDLADLKSASNIEKASIGLRKILTESVPSEIYTLHPEWDRHPTHRASAKILMELIGELPELRSAIWAYEVWGLFPRWDRFEDISSVISQKIASVQAHKSQIAVVPYTEGILGLNRWRAVFADPAQLENKATFAEVFVRLK
jgi:N-acetylglucosamine malate deacetylase 1